MISKSTRIRFSGNAFVWNSHFSWVKKPWYGTTVCLLDGEAMLKNSSSDGEEAIAAHYFDETLPQSISQTEFGKRKSRVLRQRRPSRERLWVTANYPIILFKNPGWNDNKYPILERFRKHRFSQINPKVEVDHPAMIHDVVLKSDYFGITLNGSVPDGCRSIDFAGKLTIDVTRGMSCRRSQKDAPLDQWLLQILELALKNKQA